MVPYWLFVRAEALAADEEHKKLVRIARLPIQFTQAYHVKDPAKRKKQLQAFLDNAKSLGAATLLGENRHFADWSRAEGLE